MGWTKALRSRLAPLPRKPEERRSDTGTTDDEESSFWLATSAKPIFFFLALLPLAGIYMAFQVPISVFPETNFPRVVIGVDNGVMPVEQMQVTITKPIEDAINSVPGLLTVRSTTSRGSAEISLFFDWNVDMFRTLQLTDAALARVSQSLPSDGAHHDQPSDLRYLSHPWLRAHRGRSRQGHGSADPPVGDRDLRSEAAAQSCQWGQHGSGTGRPGARVPHRA